MPPTAPRYSAPTPVKTFSHSCQPVTKKTTQVSSGNRFYANLVATRLKEEEKLRRQKALLKVREMERALEERDDCFTRVPSNVSMITRTQSSQMHSAFFQLSFA